MAKYSPEALKRHKWLWKFDDRRQIKCRRYGHSWKWKYTQQKETIGWVKVCKRCNAIESIAGKFNQDGFWIRTGYIRYGSNGVTTQGEVSRDSGDTKQANGPRPDRAEGSEPGETKKKRRE